MAPPLIDHLHRQISSGGVCDERLFTQQSNNRFRSDFEPPLPKCTRTNTGQVPFRKFSGARIAGYNVSISSRASSSISVDNRSLPPPDTFELSSNFFLPLIHGMSIAQQRKWIREIVGEVFSTRLLIFLFTGEGSSGFCHRCFSFVFVSSLFSFSSSSSSSRLIESWISFFFFIAEYFMAEF